MGERERVCDLGSALGFACLWCANDKRAPPAAGYGWVGCGWMGFVLFIYTQIAQRNSAWCLVYTVTLLLVFPQRGYPIKPTNNQKTVLEYVSAYAYALIRYDILQ